MKKSRLFRTDAAARPEWSSFPLFFLELVLGGKKIEEKAGTEGGKAAQKINNIKY
jgi:hypothetical protein